MKRIALGLAATLLAAGLHNAALAQQGTLDKIKASGTITVGHRDASIPFSYLDDKQQPIGFAMDLCARVVDAVKAHLTMPNLKVAFQPVTSATRIPLLANVTIDIECGSTTNNATRQKDVAFLNTTYVEEVRFAVKANSGITGIAQLNGKNVATTTGTTSVQHLRKHERATGMDFKEVFGKDHADSFLLLESGRADAFVMDGSILAGNIANAKTPADFRIVGEVLSVEPIAIMVRKDDAGIKKLGNDVIAGMVKSGDMAKLWDKWFVQPIPPKNVKVGLALSESTKAAWASPNDRPMEDYAKK